MRDAPITRAGQAREALIARCATIDPDRLRRGAERAVTYLGARRYQVQGSTGPRVVDLDAETPCTCPDATYRGAIVGPCLHLWAAMLAARVPAAVVALSQLRRFDAEWAA